MSRADNLAVSDKAIQDFVLQGEISDAEISAGAALGSKWFSLRRLRMGFSLSATANGYIALPTWLGGLILQWGSATFTSVSSGTFSQIINYPLTWPVSERASLCNVITNSPNAFSTSFVNGDQTKFTMYLGCSSGTWATVPVRWFAIGR
jgi:hypothetical protein